MTYSRRGPICRNCAAEEHADFYCRNCHSRTLYHAPGTTAPPSLRITPALFGVLRRFAGEWEDIGGGSVADFMDWIEPSIVDHPRYEAVRELMNVGRLGLLGDEA